MKYFAVLAALATTAFAQGISINAPTANSSVSPGQSITVEIQKPVFIQAEIDVALVLSMNPCPSSSCDTNALGDILYNGPFNPQPGPGGLLQNFTVEVPSSYTHGGLVVLIATYFELLGLSETPEIFKTNVPLRVVPAP
ncbi:hypothetical protein PsYK624_077010 [Phanerochaete sordida]|uniref:Uncharacterized protein n=1 Tax=Phanerochaete sordida TaxID=48140 RepID=A0A9P3GAZ1_9APHY|nr:hypothetical protein PsYK624_077010 [Phanerochaete sordida]